MHSENGNIQIHSENIFPIIKKWLYSDKDIFVRELISNGCDAINKLKRLASVGEANICDDEKYEVKVLVNKEAKTIKFIDNGIGMTAEEVKKYINQVAFSGAEDFLSQYKDKMDEQNQIIGHFGLGFYSSFMVSEKVEIETLSFKDNSQSVKWTCYGGTEYQLEEIEKENRGTIITLYIDEDNVEFLEEYTLRSIISKHCAFLPIEIYLENECKPEESNTSEENNEEVENESSEKTIEVPKPLNDTHPLWLKNPKDCTDEEYKDFYKKVFNDYNEPLFWIHLYVDYPFNLKGILYFPKLKHDLDASEGQIKLFNNQVFVADNIKEIIPEYLILLKGVIDCADLPLNVSRSFLQKDKDVIKISKHISKKVADKLTGLYNNEKEYFEKLWADINPFVKYGCLRDDKFYEKVKDIVIFKNISDEYVNLTSYFETCKEKYDSKAFYITDEKQQAQYIKLFKENDQDALHMTSTIDSHFIQYLEMHESEIKFQRIDSALSDSFKSESEETETDIKDKQEVLSALFKTALNVEKLDLKLENLKNKDLPAIILLSEQARRMQEFSTMFGGQNFMQGAGEEHTFVVNSNNSLIAKVLTMSKNNADASNISLICQHIYDLAMLSHKQLDVDAMTKFIQRSNTILDIIAEA